MNQNLHAWEFVADLINVPRFEASVDRTVSAPENQLRRVKLFFLIEAVARQNKLFVTEGDLEAEVRAIAQANQATVDQVREHLEKNNQSGELRLAVLERKVRNFLRESAKIVDRKGK